MKSCLSIVNPQREGKRKLETPVPSPPSPIAEESSSQKLETSVHSPPPPIDEESSSNLKPPSSISDLANKLETYDSVGNIPYSGIGPMKSFQLFAKVGLHCYNSHKGTNLRFAALTKTGATPVLYCSFNMTLDAFDPDKKSLSKIKTNVWHAPGIADLTFVITSYSLESSNESGCLWDPNGVNVLYKGEMPKWLDDPALTGSEKLQYYELNESDFLENHDLLHLYAEVGAYANLYSKMFKHHPMKVKKAVVQTKEDVDSSSKLKSRNAIFYLTFETRGGVECKCIIRQTSDGKPQHMCLEVSNVVIVE